MATQYAKSSYSEVYDMHTEFGKTTLIGIHTPTTNRWQKYMRGFCHQFKKFRYQGASLSFVPVATLPVDPLAVSYEGGEAQIDPRDMVNPIIHCGMRGESMGKYLDEIFHFNLEHKLNSVDVANVVNEDLIADLENMYYTALSSPAFKKSHPQQGFRKSGLHPMVYSLATDRPKNFSLPDTDTDADALPSSTAGPLSGEPGGNATDGFYGSFGVPYAQARMQVDYGFNGVETQRQFPQLFTNHAQSLGWLDTMQNYSIYSELGGVPAGTTEQYLTGLPKIYMYFVMLPPAYKTELYFRVIIRHFFEFKEYRNMIQPFAMETINGSAYDGVLETAPVDQAMALRMENATLDVVNGEASLMSDGSS
ncbi:putative capsid protein [Bovine faeces associated smacovirus 6]|uniref:Putative capsid protein n=1 Tax=Bovine faeces associated smacovirus 6 TaxID=1843754 RepID=A0A168MFS2_9VIRU|nr:putative capsid protein [Bovine faeces associated smacovirus 6]ANC51546.1 putative capsid protein [Bovine faeces associated smacovirus 6]